MTKLEIHYLTPEGYRISKVTSDEDGLKLARDFMKSGVNIIREQDQLFIPPHSIVGITHVKVNQ